MCLKYSSQQKSSRNNKTNPELNEPMKRLQTNLFLLFVTAFLVFSSVRCSSSREAKKPEFEWKYGADFIASDFTVVNESLDSLAEDVLKTMMDGRMERISSHFPTLEFLRAVGTGQAVLQTDSELKALMIDPLVDRFENRLTRAREEIVNSNMAMKNIRLQSVDQAPLNDPPTVPFAIELTFGDGFEQLRFRFDALIYKGRYYIF